MDQAQVSAAIEEIYDADKLARLMVEHITNDKGEILARVWENPGFQEIYDYKGQNAKRRRLKRRQEQVFHQYDAGKQLFQKLYYHPGLVQNDEIILREAFLKYNGHHETTTNVIRGGLFIAYWPITYALARYVRPTGLLIFTAAYYLGAYKYGLQRFNNSALQANLNRAAQPLAEKYGIKKLDDYIKS